MAGLVFADAHCHTNPVKGLGMKNIASKFKENNGWFLSIVGLSPWSYDITPSYEGYLKTFDLVIRECRIAKEYGLETACIVGIHPADIDKLVYRYNMKIGEAYNLALRVLDKAIELCKNGVINGIGEEGRPHYKIDPVFVVASELILMRAMEAAKDYDCIIHMHLEQGSNVTVLSVDKLAGLIGAPKKRLLFHHTRPGLTEHVIAEGYWATIPGIEPVLRIIFDRVEPKFMVESDYIDDPRRPGVVVYPWEMINNELRLLEKGVLSEELLYKVNVDNIVEFYGVNPL